MADIPAHTIQSCSNTYQAIARIADSVLSTENLEEFQKIVVNCVSSVLSAWHVRLVIIDSVSRKVLYAASNISHAGQPYLPSYLEIIEELEGWVPIEGDMIAFNDEGQILSRQCKHETKIFYGPNVTGALICSDQILGILSASNEPDQTMVSQERGDFLKVVANQVGLAIQYKQMRRTERQREGQLDALRATIADISTELELSKLLQAILERAVKLLDASGGDLGLYDEDSQELIIVASHNMGKDYSGVHMGLGEGAMGLSIKTSQPVTIDDYSHWKNASDQYVGGPWKAVLAAPFLIGKRVVGSIGVVDSRASRRFSETDQRLLTSFAQHAAIAVENARLYKTAREAAERRAILHQVSQTIVAASLDPEQIYKSIHQAARLMMAAEAFVIALFDEVQQTIDAVYLIDRGERVPAKKVPASQGLSVRVIESGQPVYVPDVIDDKNLEGATHFGVKESVRSVLAVPMRLRGNVVGMISAQSYQPGAYNAEDQYLLEMLAAYAAIALDNASLFMHIQQLAITDEVTGIFNRRHLFELGQREFLRSRRFDRPLSVIMMDIDHFKQVNDLYGHATGDQVLYRMAQLLKAKIREIDTVGRYGGEEFIIILAETMLDKAREVAERLRLHIWDTFENEKKIEIPITVSIGVSRLTRETSDFDALVKQADRAMYAAKHAGRNRVEIRKK